MRTPGPARAAALPPFQLLVDEHAGAVLRFVTSRVGPGEADDCFQETFLAALRAYPQLRDGSNLRGWLLTIARHKVVDAVRAAAKRPQPVEAIEAATPAAPERDDGLWDEVRRLPRKQRQAAALRFVEDRSYDDIARLMETSPDAARRNVHEAVRKLRRRNA